MKEIDVTNLNEVLKVLIPNGISYEIKAFSDAITANELADFRTKFPLSRKEFQAVRRAIPKREVEYRTGRFLIKKLLDISQFNTDTNLYKKNNGAPNWPAGIIGSITHSGSICIAAISNTNTFSGIGLDLEQGEFRRNDEKYLAHYDELHSYPGHLNYTAKLRVVFSCKEAIFKSLERVLVEPVDFKDVAIQFASTIESNIFEYDFQCSREIPNLETPINQNFYGRVYADEKLVVSIAAFYAQRNKT